MKYTGAQILIRLLQRQGIMAIPGIPGGANLPIYDALYKSRIRHILARHEQGAGFIAQGMARSTGKAAVCFATSGPGATNLITAIADAKLDSIAIIAITGQVPTSLLGTDAFQEIDMYGLTIPITKHNFLVRNTEDLLRVIPEAFKIAQSGRPGPVVIDIPKDVQLKEIEVRQWPRAAGAARVQRIDKNSLKDAAQLINRAKRPVLYAGAGIINADACGLLYKFAKKNSIPAALTLMGLGCFPADDQLCLGMLGMHGARYTNLIMQEADLVLAFGVRFDDRATGSADKFCSKAKIIHIDIDPSEINKIKKAHLSVAGDIAAALRELIPDIETNRRSKWMGFIREMKKKYALKMPDSKDILHPVNIIKKIAGMVPEDTIITTDVGQHQMWTAQAYPFKKPRTFQTSGGLGTMGFGLPAAIGAALANPRKTVICFSGDGSFLMNIQELATLADLNLNVKVLVMNNGHLGLVRQQQELFYSGKYIATRFRTNPDFAGIARDFGIPGYDLSRDEGSQELLIRALSEKGPAVINAKIHYAQNVFPMVAPGAANDQMIGGE